jgi:DNA-binding IclR family transcriptional regulator
MEMIGHSPTDPQNRSLVRGIAILRAFRPGTDLLGNGELAERTGLPRATVSRLTHTLVSTGMLTHDRRARAYRLAAPLLSLAHAMRLGSPVLQAAAPLMRKTAEKLHVNVGLAVADHDEMVYLESIRYSPKVSLRYVLAGQRIPIELTSLGRAWLAVCSDAQRQRVLAQLKINKPAEYTPLLAEIEQARQAVQSQGFCVASWQPDVVALACPVWVSNQPIYALNISVTTHSSLADIADRLGPVLLDLAKQITLRLA